MIQRPVQSSSSQPLDYAHLPSVARWSPIPAMVVSGLYGVGLTVAAGICELTFRPFYVAFKVDLPQATEWCFQFSRLVWADFGWIGLIPALTFMPLGVVPIIPAPQSSDRRRTIAWILRIAAVFVFFATAIFIAMFMTAPMNCIMTGVSGPQKQ